MCGIAGLYNEKLSSDEFLLCLQKMENFLHHRGPDDSGIWKDKNSSLGLVHTRLSIQDLSKNGSQPMLSNDGRYLICFNGEIYNHLNLRKNIEKKGAIKWRSTSDTETLVEHIKFFGLSKTLRQASGMFAFALYDKEYKKLYLARDRFGEKPLYYGWNGDSFFFASELKAISKLGIFKKKLSKLGLNLYLKFGYVPTPYSIWEGIKKCEPGTFLSITLEEKNITKETFWNAKQEINLNKSRKYFDNYEDVLRKTNDKITDAVKEQMISDVPIGAFLSGGIDSSLISSIMQDISDKPINTFSVGIDNEKYDESGYAKEVANALGTNHFELKLSSNDLTKSLPSISNIYDEPFSDPSSIPTFLISEFAKKNVSVVLTGDSGDEVFAGYNRHLYTYRYWKFINLFPLFIRKFIARILLLIPSTTIDNLGLFLKKFYKKIPSYLGDKMHKGASVLSSKNTKELYNNLITIWSANERVLKPNFICNMNEIDNSTEIEGLSISTTENMMIEDISGYMMDDILVKVDRAAMSNSLETRVPFLNHSLFMHSLDIPINLKLKDGRSKSILKDILKEYLDTKLIDRPKMGFGIPIDSWLRGPLKKWAQNILLGEKIRKDGYFDYNVIEEKWIQHQSCKKNWDTQLWTIIMFQLWYDEFGDIE